jgi:hypothetical protein
MRIVFCLHGRFLLAAVACATVAVGLKVPWTWTRSHCSPARCLRTESRVVSLRMRRGEGRREGPPIDFYYWPVPCGWKVAIMLEECALPYRLHPVNILQGDQFDPAYLALNPNNKVRNERKAAQVALRKPQRAAGMRAARHASHDTATDCRFKGHSRCPRSSILLDLTAGRSPSLRAAPFSCTWAKRLTPFSAGHWAQRGDTPACSGSCSRWRPWHILKSTLYSAFTKNHP